jgi:hypothetical protein
MNSEYIVNGRVSRNKIAWDVKNRKLNRPAIERLLSDPMTSSAFIGSGFNNKRSKREWDKAYLEKLTYSSVAECFNPEYLYYLDEVADFVSKAKIKKIVIGVIVIVLVIIAGVVVLSYVLTGGI